MVLNNDTRGWIMTCVSGIACVAGSSIICVDLFIQSIPGRRNFRIQDSNAFLSSSLSLSFGVMLFSSLYSMLPAAKAYLIAGHLSPQAAAYATISSFLAGVIAIQFVSRLLHHYAPSQVVDCNHSHQEETWIGTLSHVPHRNDQSHGQDGMSRESTPLLPGERPYSRFKPLHSTSDASDIHAKGRGPDRNTASSGRPSLKIVKQLSNAVLGGDQDKSGPCYCPNDTPSSPLSPRPSTSASRRAFPDRNTTTQIPETTAKTGDDSSVVSPKQLSRPEDVGHARDREEYPTPHFLSLSKNQSDEQEAHSRSDISSAPPNDSSQLHHHHVPTNVFLAIGLQTSIAIALHKLPEGFITFATNHANPKLGFAVFMALFIHNISEGFVMALPLYLALGSRWKSIFWSSLLGGISQPMGAGVAALWFKLARRHDVAPGDRVYGCMFAITAGVMTSVALSLFTESIGLTHNRPWCIAFAFIGMGIMGFSFALTAS